MRKILFLFLFFSVSCQTDPVQDPVTPAPVIKGKALTLWATMYYLPIHESTTGPGVDILDMKNQKLGIRVTNEEFCVIAMEGSGVIDGKVITYAGTNDPRIAKCKHSASERVRFALTDHEFGTGAKNIALIPFKSIAVDPTVIPYESRVFIQEAKGTILPDGSVHDGIFFAHDTGGLIKGNHIDVFIGPVKGSFKDVLKKNPFTFIKSNEKGTFEAIVLE